MREDKLLYVLQGLCGLERTKPLPKIKDIRECGISYYAAKKLLEVIKQLPVPPEVAAQEEFDDPKQRGFEDPWGFQTPAKTTNDGKPVFEDPWA